MNPSSRNDIYLRSIIMLILSSHLYLDLFVDLYPMLLPIKTFKTLLPSPSLATWPAHLMPIYFITLNLWDERIKLCFFSLFLHFGFSWVQVSGITLWYFEHTSINSLPNTYIWITMKQQWKFLTKMKNLRELLYNSKWEDDEKTKVNRTVGR